jgi:hypothetical protein
MATKLSPQEFVAKWRHITLVEKHDNWLNPPGRTETGVLEFPAQWTAIGGGTSPRKTWPLACSSALRSG